MVHSRNKGHRRERAIRHRFIAAGWPDAKRGDQSRAGHEESDVCVGDRVIEIWGNEGGFCFIDVPGFRCEVKDQKKLPGVGVLNSYRQAVKAAKAGEVPLAVFHVARDDDYVFMRFGDFIQLASCGTAGDAANNGAGADHGDDDGGSEQLEDAI